MNRPELALTVATVAAIVAIVVAGPLFLPEEATVVEASSTPTGIDRGPTTVVATGTFEGKAGHTVRGQVSLVEDAEGYLLRFEDYEQTQGPDVYVYLTQVADPDTRGAVGAGYKVRIDGGAGNGESTKVGTFEQRLPDDLDPRAFRGVAIWCDRFATPFGAATLEPVA
ncbi:MAG: DM13 domain-containing protein [Halobacteriales archaeon]|nr:DM13 domain-containing protein [Halobacteriales archaeon]